MPGKINPLVTVKGDLFYFTHGLSPLTMTTLEMETRLQSDMGGSCRRITGERATTEWIAMLWQYIQK